MRNTFFHNAYVVASFSLLGAVTASSVFGWISDGDTVRLIGATGGALIAIIYKIYQFYKGQIS
jgi:hypothetical protein